MQKAGEEGDDGTSVKVIRSSWPGSSVRSLSMEGIARAAEASFIKFLQVNPSFFPALFSNPAFFFFFFD